MAKKRSRKQRVTTADLEAADRQAAAQGTGDTERVRRIREARRAPVRRSVDNDILFALPAGKGMLAVLAIALVLYVGSYLVVALGSLELQAALQYAAYALFAVSFVLLVVARTQTRRRTAAHRRSGGAANHQR